MKKTLLLLFVCTVSTHMIAQKTKSEKAETPTQTALSENDIAPPVPTPPPPPPPPAPEVPTAPAPPPAPPVPPQIEQAKFTPPVIVNDKGYSLSVHYYNGKNLVYMKKKGVSEKISLDKWNENRAYYENKYGVLPAPPPPAPPAPAEPSVKNEF